MKQHFVSILLLAYTIAFYLYTLYLQVHLQTQQEGKISIVRLTTSIIQKQGILALYNGLSASLLRQLTYSTIRFGAYEVCLFILYTIIISNNISMLIILLYI